MTGNTVYLITGANRGIGLGFVTQYLSSPRSTVIACVRDTSHPTSQSLASLLTGPDSRLVTVQMDSSSASSIANAIQRLKDDNIPKIDVVIANAGISQSMGSLASIPIGDIKRHIEINAFGPLLLFQHALSLLQKSSYPKFVVISSFGGSTASLEMVAQLPIGPYGASKALVNHFMRRLAMENTNLCVWSLVPGLVSTDMSTEATSNGIVSESLKAFPLITVEESVTKMANIIDNATKERTSGRFLNYTGEEIPW